MHSTFRGQPPPSRVLANLALAARVSLSAFGDDPLTFGIQLSRRIPAARRLLGSLNSRVSVADSELVKAWLATDVETARQLLLERDRTRLSRVAAEIAQAAGLPELVADDPSANPTTRARALWQLGEASAAVRLLAVQAPKQRLYRTLAAELQLLQPGRALHWVPPSSIERATPRGSRGVLHLLSNSLPHTQSGYTVRSQAVLRAQQDVGLAPVAMTRIGYPVVVGAIASGRSDVVDGIEYHRALPFSLAMTPVERLQQQADALITLAREVDPMGIQTTTNYPNALVARAVARALRLPWAYEVRGMLEQTWVAGLATGDARARATSSERFRLARDREAELAEDADAVFTLGNAMRDDLVARGVSRESVRLVPNAVNASAVGRTKPSPAHARLALGLPSDGFWVGSTSSIVAYEGFDVLLKAVAEARAAGHDMRALIVGDGSALPGLRTLVARLDLPDAVVMPGRVGRDEVNKWHAALDVVVVPRVDRAVTRTVAPLKPVEAMASGTPIIASDLPPLRDVVGEVLASEGALVPPGDSSALAARLAALAARPELRARLSALGLERASTVTWSAVGQVYHETWSDLAERRL